MGDGADGSTADQRAAAGQRSGDDDADSDGSGLPGVTVTSMVLRETDHWTGIVALAFLVAGAGVLANSRTLLLATVVVVGYVAYSRAFEGPTVNLGVERSFSDARPDPGDRVTVTVTVQNVGSETLPDLRLIEGVPDALAVVDGPARTATALRPGARVMFSYTVLARRGEYSFEELTAIARDPSGSRERELAVATEPAVLTCIHSLEATADVPLRALTSRFTGRVKTDVAGEGVEFHSTREYRHGDTLSRIDWNRLAAGGDLATLEFREERMATVILLLDLRKQAYLQPDADHLHAVERSIDAAGQLVHSLLDTGDRVGIAAFASEDVWLPPGAGPTHRANARHLLATHPALSPTPPEERAIVRTQLRELRRQFPDDAQVVLLSPIPDNVSVYAAQVLHARGHAVTVLSPDPTLPDSPGRKLASVTRSNRINGLRNGAIRVIDWQADESITEALERAGRRWSA
jgi:uncharacterized protein (DUF58 family)